jgi:hypothetical protein
MNNVVYRIYDLNNKYTGTTTLLYEANKAKLNGFKVVEFLLN